MSLYFQPCGREPLGMKQARYEANFYTIIPQYRAFMVCEEEDQSPKICKPRQSSFLGRGHFTVPRVERSTDVFANMPQRFAPADEPQAMQYEGLSHWDANEIPPTIDRWQLPQMEMSTYDGDVITYRTLLPADFITGPNSSEFYSETTFNFQTMLRLPSNFNMTYNGNTEEASILLSGQAGLCGSTFESMKADQEEEATTRRLRGL